MERFGLNRRELLTNALSWVRTSMPARGVYTPGRNARVAAPKSCKCRAQFQTVAAAAPKIRAPSQAAAPRARVEIAPMPRADAQHQRTPGSPRSHRVQTAEERTASLRNARPFPKPSGTAIPALLSK